MPLVGSRSSQPCSGPSQAPTQACDWSAPRRRVCPGARPGADVAGDVACRQAEPAQRADHQMGEVLAHPLAPPQHLRDRRAGRRHAGAEGEIPSDPGVQIEQRRQHRAAGREAGRRVGRGAGIGRGARAVEQELGGLPRRGAGLPRACRDGLPGRGRRGIGRRRKPHIDGRLGDHLERRVGDIEEQPGHLVAEMVAAVAPPRHRRCGVHAGAQHALMRQRTRPQMREMRAEIDRRSGSRSGSCAARGRSCRAAHRSGPAPRCRPCGPSAAARSSGGTRDPTVRPRRRAARADAPAGTAQRPTGRRLR